jgi:acyl carrier protein
MERTEVEQKVRETLAEQLARDMDEVTLNARFEEDLDADSLDLVEAVLALEEAMGVEIPEEEMEGVKTVGQAVDLVMGKLGATSSA